MFLLQVSVGHIVPGGSADIDGRLRTGDEIMYVDSHCVLNASHHKVVQLMGNAAINGRVSLRIRRRLLTTSASVTGQSMPGNHYSVTFCFTLFAWSLFLVTFLFLLSHQNLSFQLNQLICNIFCHIYSTFQTSSVGLFFIQSSSSQRLMLSLNKLKRMLN